MRAPRTAFLRRIGIPQRIKAASRGSADLDVFNSAVPFPDPPIPERPVPDLRLRPGSAAVDAGAVLPNINDDYKGAAPDLGAYELGQELPTYGPRPEGLDEATPFAAKTRRAGAKRRGP